MAKSKYPAVPFRVVLRLATPVAISHPWLHLDSIMAHLATQRIMGRAYYDLPTKQPAHLGEREKGKYAHIFPLIDGLVHASASIFSPGDKHGTLQYFKRYEAQGSPGRAKVNLGSGHYRNWMMRWVYVPAETVTFFGFGRIAHIHDLLPDLTHLGNDTRVGWGRIQSMEVQETEEDWSVVYQGRAMRPIPVRLLTSWSDSAPMACRPPYWARESIEECAPPGAEVILRVAPGA